MIGSQTSSNPAKERPGKVLVTLALLLPVLLGMVGLALDSGMMLGAYRQVQNVADSAALAAALDLLNGKSGATAISTGTTYVHSHNGMPGATVTINIPPLSGPNVNSSTYAEVIVNYPFSTSFVQLLGINRSQSITARAVAGYQISSPEVGVMTLQQTPPGGTGLTVGGNSTLNVDGPVIDNATSSSAALLVYGSSTFYATKVSVSGGASGASRVLNYPNGGGTSPVVQNTGVDYTDPLASLPVPSTSNGVVNTYYGLSGSTLQRGYSTPQDIKITSATVTLQPGIYGSITINSNANVTFNTGLYIIAGGGMTINGGATVSTSTGGVMFYNTANNYRASTGSNGESPTFGSITINGGALINLSGLANTSSPFSGMFIFQDRANTQGLTVTGNSSQPFTGTYYAPNANLTATGDSTFNLSQFIVGSMTVTGNTIVNVNPPGGPSSANLVFLME